MFDARYYAEPTTMIPSSDNLSGGNILKSLTPYPIFLPAIIDALLETYASSSGAERLRRRGADIQGGARDSGQGSHGDWGLIPDSLGLVVIAVTQRVALDRTHRDTSALTEFVANHPTCLQVSWMHGGSRLLFYRNDGRWDSDGDTVVDGLQCRLWISERLGMHARDVNHLADVFDKAEQGLVEFKPLVR